ncbi:MAG TPA: hypothetical protein DDX40_02015 [Rikenellaceae bacterium]|nr:hypothetical protein [Rikenellaceae bacterium]
MKEVPYELFKKYFNGETDDSENRRLIEWLLEDKENEKVFADTLSVISAADVVRDERFEARRDAFFERLSRKIDEQDAAASRKRRRNIGFAFAGGLAAVLAAVAVFLFTPGEGYLYRSPMTYTSYSNTSNDSDIICLPDGSTVWIMGGSSLRYGSNVSKNGGKREICLDGEAFFDVAKDTIHPFVVKTPNLSVVAVGTRFNVRVKECGDTEVMLEEGSVRLCNPQGVSLMRLLPDQTAVLDGKTGDIFIEQHYVQSEIRLKYNVIALTDATLEEIKENIEKTYGVSIKIKGTPAEDRRYNFSCLKSRGVEEAVAILSHLTGTECEICGK